MTDGVHEPAANGGGATPAVDATGIVRRVAAHVRPFSRVATDGRHAVLALERRKPFHALVVRTSREPARLVDDEGRPVAVVERRWAAMAARLNGAPRVLFAGSVSRTDAPSLVAAWHALGGAIPVVSSERIERILAAAGADKMFITHRPHPVASALVRAAGGAALVGGLPAGLKPYIRRADLASVADNLEVIEAWGVPPPERTIRALGAYGRVLVTGTPRVLDDYVHAPVADRAGLLAAVRRFVGRFRPSARATVDGEHWNVYTLMFPWPHFHTRAVALPCGPDIDCGDTGLPEAEIPDLGFAPERDIAWEWTRFDSPGYLAPRTLDVLFADLAERMERASGDSAMEALSLAISLLVGPLRREGATVVIEYVAAPFGRTPIYPKAG